MSIRLVAIDLDDTLLTDELHVSPGSVDAIERARAAGVHVIIATGRMYASAEPFARQLDLEGPHVVYNGALVRTVRGEQLLHRPIGSGLASEAIDFAAAGGWSFQCYVNDRLYVPAINPEVLYYSEVSGVAAQTVKDMPAFIAGSEPTKMLAIGSPEETEERAAALREHFGERLAVTISKPYFVEVMHPGVSKATALAHVSDGLDIPQEKVLAIGDSFNDAEMLQWAGIGVAMGNARPEVQQLADHVVSSNMDEGVAEAIDRFVLA